MKPPSATLARGGSQSESCDILCFSHLRWNFVYQRPQHLLTRFASQQRVFFVEEPVYEPVAKPTLKLTRPGGEEKPARGAHGVVVATPVLPLGTSPSHAIELQRSMVDQLIASEHVRRFLAWYYTPMALAFTGHLLPLATVYDCMDELAAFKGAPPSMAAHERELFRRADVVFTGGYSLYEAKKNHHPNVHAFPSSIDFPHFAHARTPQADPADQRSIPHPRIGFFGVLDERLDRDLLDEVARLRPEWHFVMIGPVVKIDPAELPDRPNIHYLGAKSYRELPAYIAGWELAMLPFAQVESTRYISPTKTPEYLAAGKAVVSTPIFDVVHAYGNSGSVHIAGDAASFAAAMDHARSAHNPQSQAHIDRVLAQSSWDTTWRQMSRLIAACLEARLPASFDPGTLHREAGLHSGLGQSAAHAAQSMDMFDPASSESGLARRPSSSAANRANS